MDYSISVMNVANKILDGELPTREEAQAMARWALNSCATVPNDVFNAIVRDKDREIAQHDDQVRQLARVLLEEFGGPDRSEGAIEMAIRTLRNQAKIIGGLCAPKFDNCVEQSAAYKKEAMSQFGSPKCTATVTPRMLLAAYEAEPCDARLANVLSAIVGELEKMNRPMDALAARPKS
jgi:hypothetical protein